MTFSVSSFILFSNSALFSSLIMPFFFSRSSKAFGSGFFWGTTGDSSSPPPSSIFFFSASSPSFLPPAGGGEKLIFFVERMKFCVNYVKKSFRPMKKKKIRDKSSLCETISTYVYKWLPRLPSGAFFIIYITFITMALFLIEQFCISVASTRFLLTFLQRIV